MRLEETWEVTSSLLVFCWGDMEKSVTVSRHSQAVAGRAEEDKMVAGSGYITVLFLWDHLTAGDTCYFRKVL